MADGVETMAYNGQNGIPWHQLGVSVEGAQDGESMRKAAGLDWQVVKQPLFTIPVVGTGYLAVDSRVAIVRDTDNAVIGTVGATYQPIQNSELFDFADALLATGEVVKFETAGSLNGGRVVWALASVPERAITIDGDPQGQIMPYLVLSSGHDGLRALSAAFSPVRVVCQNTLNMALKGARDTFVIRHTVNAMPKVEAARKALRFNVEYLETLEKVSAQLMKRKMTVKDVIAATEALIPSMAAEPEKALKAQAQRDLILGLFQNSANLDGVPMSGYRFVHAVAEYADHVRTYRKTKKGTPEDARALAILDGTATDIKEAALKLVLPTAARGRFTAASVG